MAAFLCPVPFQTFTRWGVNTTNRRPSSRARLVPVHGPRMAMRSDSIAPVITIKNTQSDQTSTVGLAMEAIPASEAAGAALLAKTSLVASLSQKGAGEPAGVAALAAGSAPEAEAADVRAVVERYFPNEYRGTAPVVEISADGVGVTWRKIEQVVGGVPSGDAGGVVGPAGPFWKQKDLKWVTASGAETPGTAIESPQPEVLETGKFERWFPTKIRNRAPRIRIGVAKYEGDPTAFLEVGSEFVGLDESLVKRLELPTMSPSRPEARAAATVTKFYRGRTPNRAPVIEVNAPYSVVVDMKEIESPLEEAANVAREFQSVDTIIERNYPAGLRNTAPLIDISSAEEKVGVSMGFVEESSKQAEQVFQSVS